MHRLKSLYYLLEALKSLPEVTLHIIGEKHDFTEKRFVSAGIKRGKGLVKEMQKATVLVLPSIRHMEGFPMVLIEAMACQTPVIGTDQGGIPAERQFSNKVRRESTHVGLVPVNAGWYKTTLITPTIVQVTSYLPTSSR